MRINRRVAAVFAGGIFVALLFMALRPLARDKPVLASLDTLPVIIIDAGHGGMDGGAVGAEGIVEKDINLSICLSLRDMFKANGFTVVMTRDTDISIHDEGLKSVRKQKTSDLRNRLAIANSYPNAIFLSIHQNKFSDSKSNGAQIFFSPNNEASEKLAEILQQRFVRNLQPENKRQIKKAGKNLFLMYEATCPAVLVECGFLSNKQEAQMLSDPEHQSKIAFTAFCAVMDFLDMDTPETLNE